MSKRWVYSDPHFNHANMCNFTNFDGSPVRPWDDVNDMDNEMIERWNSRVADEDVVIILGDVAIQRHGLHYLDKLRGKKRLVGGNHDIFKLKDYLQYFEDIKGVYVRPSTIGNICMTHFPIHTDSLGKYACNVHGHTHGAQVMLNGKPDVRYLCVCVEHTDYAPLEWGEMIDRVEARKVVAFNGG